METPLDDSQLLRLAADQRTPLFSEPSRTAVLAPLVIVLSLLPALAIPLASQFDETSARWGLRAIDVATAQQLAGWLEPGRAGFGRALAFQSPLMSWLTAVVVRTFGMDRSASWHGVSLLATCLCLGATYRLARRLGGGMYSLIVVVCLACHPLTVQFVTQTTPAALGMLLIVLTMWGFVSHLESARSLVSVRLLVGGLAWGLSVLAIGPCSIAVLLPLFFYLLLGGGYSAMVVAPTKTVSLATVLKQASGIGVGAASLLLLIATGLSFSSWWVLMMLSEYGVPFGNSWWLGSLVLDPSSITVSYGKRGWLTDNALILGWLLLGLVELGHNAARSGATHAKSHHRFVSLWWWTAVLARVTFEAYGPRESVQSDVWEAFLLIPTVLIIGWGIEAVLNRRTAPFQEALLIAITLGLMTWRWTDRTTAGIGASAVALIATALLPVVADYWQGNSHRWCERNWRRFLRLFVMAFILVHLTSGLWDRPRVTLDDAALIELRQRLRAIPAVRQITFVTVNEAAPATLRFLLLSRWPTAQFKVVASWNGGMSNDSTLGNSLSPSVPRSAENQRDDVDLVVEWSRRETRMSGENLTHWETTPVGDPLRYGGRKLALHLIRPRRR